MEKVIFKEIYPIFTRTIDKKDISLKSVDEIVEYLKQKVEAHPVAQLISVFDNFSHTKNIEGEINPTIKDARSVIFCFGRKIPATKAVALRPRSIAVCELEDKFIIEFIEAPKEELHNLMESWAKNLKIQ